MIYRGIYRNKFFASILTILVLLSVLFIYYYPQFTSSNSSRHNIHDTLNLPPSRKYTVDEYLKLFYSVPSDIMDVYEGLRPWYNRSFNYNYSILYNRNFTEAYNIIQRLYHDTLDKLNNVCDSILWRQLVSYMDEYYLGVKDMLQRALRAYKGDQGTIIINRSGYTKTITVGFKPNRDAAYTYLKGAIEYMVYLNTLKNSTWKKLACNVSFDKFKRLVYEFYNYLKSYIKDKKEKILREISLEELKNIRFYTIYSSIAYILHRILESNRSLLVNENRFDERVRYNIFIALNGLFTYFYLADTYLEIMKHPEYVNNLDMIAINYDYLAQKKMNITNQLRRLIKLAENAEDPELRLLLMHATYIFLVEYMSRTHDLVNSLLGDGIGSIKNLTREKMLEILILDNYATQYYIEFILFDNVVRDFINIIHEEQII